MVSEARQSGSGQTGSTTDRTNRLAAEMESVGGRQPGATGTGGGDHQGFPPAMYPTEPLHPAPARFGTAGISGGEEWRIKTHIEEWRGHTATRGLANGLGWFSIGLGLTELLAARELAGWLGMEDKSHVVRLYGVREVVKGVGILSNKDPAGRAPWLWGRVAGDALDLATLALGMSEDNPKRDNVSKALVAVAGVTALDVLCATQLSREAH